MNDIEKKAEKVLNENRVAVFVVAYNAEKHIQKVLERIPPWIAEKLTEIFIIDDSSKDLTSEQAATMKWGKGKAPLKIFRTPTNQGYGGNQKIGYAYAIEQKFDIVVLLHGDGQYAPESLPDILAPYDDGYDAVFGSRFLTAAGALKGGMPLYKWLGNRVLTGLQNRLLQSNMSEMHSGYRSYRVASMAKVPFHCNSGNFHFDAEIIVQFHDAGFRIKEVPIPTFYGDEICHVNGFQYAYNCMKTFVKYRLMQLEIFYDPKYDIRLDKPHPYTAKVATTSLHHYIRNLDLEEGCKILDVGGGDGAAVSKDLSTTHKVTCIDQYAPDESKGSIRFIQADLNQAWSEKVADEGYEVALALDVVEHVNPPEHCVNEIHMALGRGGQLYASTANVGYIIIRIMLLFGWFNYGRRGILDLTHTRLMTVGSFRRLLEYGGFNVEKIIGFGPPIGDLTNSGLLTRMLDRIAFILARLWPRMFAFNFLAVCTRNDNFKNICVSTTSDDLRGAGEQHDD